MLTNKQTAIVLFTYNRPQHTSTTLEAIRNCEGVENYPFYVFCDGQKNEIEEIDVKKTQHIFKILKWPSKIIVEYSQKNKGLASSIIEGVSKVLRIHESVIVIEDDIVLSNFALRYFSKSLQLYKRLHSVMSVSGYGFPTSLLSVPKTYPYDAYFFPRLISWGWATWRDRWEQIDWEMDSWFNLRMEPWVRQTFARVGPDLPEMMDAQLEGRIDSWAVRFVWNHFLKGCQSLIPIYSYTQNIGMDGTGIHSDRTRRYLNDLGKAIYEPRFPPAVSPDWRISMNAARVYRKTSITKRGLRWFARKVCLKP